MEEAGVAMKYPKPLWMNKDGIVVSKEDSYGFKVTHDLNYTEMCLVCNEVRGNTSPKGDGQKGGQLMVCGKYMEPQQQGSTREKNLRCWD